MQDLRRLGGVELQTFLSDRGLQAQAKRWLQVAAECTLDLAHHLIADRGWPTPATHGESFQTLQTHGVITPELSKALQGWAGLRNLLAHQYLVIDHERLHQIFTTELQVLEQFAAAVLKSIKAGS